MPRRCLQWLATDRWLILRWKEVQRAKYRYSAHICNTSLISNQIISFGIYLIYQHYKTDFLNGMQLINEKLLHGLLYYLDFKLDEIKTLQYLTLIHSNNSCLVKIESNRYYIQTLQREIILGICCKIDTRCKNTHRVFIVLL